MISVRHGPDRIGLLEKPPAAQHLFPSSECGRTQPLFRAGQDHGKTSGRKPKGLSQILIIIMKHIIHNHYFNNQP